MEEETKRPEPTAAANHKRIIPVLAAVGVIAAAWAGYAKATATSVSMDLPAAPPFESTTTTLDEFESASGWRIIKPPEVRLSLETGRGVQGGSLCLDYDLSEKRLYAVVVKDFPIDLPDNFQISFAVRGVSPANNLELKIVDENDNTYRKVWENFQFSGDWVTLTARKSDMPFGWGPQPGAPLKRARRFEIALSCGTGGRGKIFVDDLRIATLPSAPAAATNLRNPSFEGGLNEWEKSGAAKFIDCLTFQKHEGGSAAGIGNDGGPDGAEGVLAQTLVLPFKPAAGDLFVYSMWMMAEEKFSGEASLKLDFLGADGSVLLSSQSEISRGKFDWKKVVVSTRAPAGVETVRASCVAKGLKRGEGGSFVWFDDGEVLTPVATASTSAGADGPLGVLLPDGAWRSKSGWFESPGQWLTLDFRTPRKITGLAIDWDADYAAAYDVYTSNDGAGWTRLLHVEKDGPDSDRIYCDETFARFIRLNCLRSAGRGYGIREVAMMDATALVGVKDYFRILAAQAPDLFPRWMVKQQAYWATVGVYDDKNEATLCEDGAVEPWKRGPTITPFLHVDGRLLSRGDAEVTQWLDDTYLPIPNVGWKAGDLAMEVKLFAEGERGKSSAYALYTIRNDGGSRKSGSLFLAVRPYQFYPPWQGGTDGFAPIRRIQTSETGVVIDGRYRVLPFANPSAVGATAGAPAFRFPFKTPSPPDLGGDVTSFLRRGEVPPDSAARDLDGFAAAAMRFDFDLPPGESRRIAVAVPLHEADPAVSLAAGEAAALQAVEALLARNAAFWHRKIDRFEIDIPEMDLVHFWRANVGWNLVTLDEAVLQPGARSYDKGWWRDGSIQASSLMKSGLVEEARTFYDYMISFQYPTGEMPPIVDNKAEDPLWEERPPLNLKEYDAQGEMVTAMLEHYYFTRDREYLERRWENIHRNLRFTRSLRE